MTKKYSELVYQKMSETARLISDSAEFLSGWIDIINNLTEDIDKIEPDFRISQIKEKFGGLRFYVTYHNQEIGQLISSAEEESFQTCIKCGQKGKLRNDNGYYVTLCNNHFEVNEKD